MLGGGPEVTSTWVECPVLLHEISMIKNRRWRREKEKKSKNKTNTKKIAWFPILDVVF